MLRKKCLLLGLRVAPVTVRSVSSVASEGQFERKRYKGVMHPDNRLASVSCEVLSEQSALQNLPSIDTSLEETRRAKNLLSGRLTTDENQYLRLAEAVTPLWKVPYKKQLNIKWLKSMEFLKVLKKRLSNRCVDLQGDRYGLPCDLSTSLPSPKWRGYKNKDEFLVHVGIDGFTPTVGFGLGNPRELYKTVCVGPQELTNVKPEHKEVAQLFQEYVQNSNLPVTRHFSKNYWRKLLVRSNHCGELMISATMHPQGLTQADIDKEKKHFVHFFTEGPGSELELRSMYFQTWQDEGFPPHTLLWGDPHLEEVQSNLKLRVCPHSSLLENSAVADIFFQAIVEAAELKPDTTLLDVSCGTGALSLRLAQMTSRVIGVKLTPGKITDVFYNAETNGIGNVSFTQRQLPTVLKQLRRHNLNDLVAVINPTEHYLSRKSVMLLKDIKPLRRIVFVTDQLDGKALKNILILCQTYGKTFDGSQFFPVKAIPVDIYPQTNNYYFVIVFDRFS